MIKEIRIYDDEGTLLKSEPICPEGVNVSIAVSGLTATNLQAALTEILEAMSNLRVGSGYTSGVVVDGVGELDVAFGKISAGTDIDGLTVSQLLKTAFGSTQEV